jgi:hypothetical protein
MKSKPLAVFTILFAVGMNGCSNYRFRDARRPDGKLDLERLLRDQRAEKKTLFEWSWLPLLHCRLTIFSATADSSAGAEKKFRYFAGLDSAKHYPPGHTLTEVDGWGPLFAFARERESHYDLAKEGYEVNEERTLLGGLWQQERSLVETGHGTRVESRHNILFGLKPPFSERVVEVKYLPPEGVEQPGNQSTSKPDAPRRPLSKVTVFPQPRARLVSPIR